MDITGPGTTLSPAFRGPLHPAAVNKQSGTDHQDSDSSESCQNLGRVLAVPCRNGERSEDRRLALCALVAYVCVDEGSAEHGEGHVAHK